MKPKPQEKNKRATNHPTQHHWHEMNRKQRRETMRKIQSEDLTLEVLHPDAAGIDIGNEISLRGGPPPSRDTQPVRRCGCTTAELKAMADPNEAVQDTNRRHSNPAGSIGSPHTTFSNKRVSKVYLVNAGHGKSLQAQSDVQESQWLMKLHTYGLLQKFLSAITGDSHDADLLEAAQRSRPKCRSTYSADARRR